MFLYIIIINFHFNLFLAHFMYIYNVLCLNLDFKLALSIVYFSLIYFGIPVVVIPFVPMIQYVI
jgi:hypothetical protein